MRLGEDLVPRVTAKLRPDDRLTLNSMHHLANAYLAVNRTADAIKLLEQTVKVVRTPGADTASTDVYLSHTHSLAAAYSQAGRFQDAIPLREEVLTQSRIKFGNDHEDTLSRMRFCGLTYQKAGRLADALPI